MIDVQRSYAFGLELWSLPVRTNLAGHGKRRIRLAPYVFHLDPLGQFCQRQAASLSIDLEDAEIGDYLANASDARQRERTILEDLASAVLIGVIRHHDDL